MGKVLMKGNEAIGEAAIRAGCRCFFGYPITPQNEVPEYMSREMPQAGGVFVQAESEVAAINMVYGAAATGKRVLTSSSSPGIALKQEGISYIAGAELPCVIVNVMRGGPGLGGIQPSQADYFQATRGGGNGDYYMPVYAPYSIQEAVDMVAGAFPVAERYRSPVMVIADGMIGQMMEAVDLDNISDKQDFDTSWCTLGTQGKRKPNIINSLELDPAVLENHVQHLAEKFDHMRQNLCQCESEGLEEAEIVLVAYGTTARIAKNAIKICGQQGIDVGLIRPKTVWPYPNDIFNQIGPKCKALLTVEMSLGQMLDDVKIVASGRWPVHFFGRTGGIVPTPKEIAQAVIETLEKQS